MHWKRATRLVWLLVSNLVILYFAVRLMFAGGAETALEACFDRALGATVSAWCSIALTGELANRPWSKKINIALPLSIAALMISTVVWLPLVSHDSDVPDAVIGFLVYSIAPICLAILNYLAYRLTREAGSSLGPTSNSP